MEASQNGVPKSALVIMAHPDDAEFTVAGTVAKWAQAGCEIVYVLCTSGNAGTHEPEMTREKLAAIRQEEQERSHLGDHPKPAPGARRRIRRSGARFSTHEQP